MRIKRRRAGIRSSHDSGSDPATLTKALRDQADYAKRLIDSTFGNQ